LIPAIVKGVPCVAAAGETLLRPGPVTVKVAALLGTPFAVTTTLTGPAGRPRGTTTPPGPPENTVATPLNVTVTVSPKKSLWLAHGGLHTRDQYGIPSSVTPEPIAPEEGETLLIFGAVSVVIGTPEMAVDVPFVALRVGTKLPIVTDLEAVRVSVEE
jgi:hypothetical protein